MGMVVDSYRFAAAPGGITDPSDLANLAFWFDASDTATITSSGGAVTAVADKGPNGYDVSGTGPTTGSHTQNGLNVLTWAGSLTHDAGSDVIDLAPFTACIVVYSNALDAQFRRMLSSRQSATGAHDYQSPNMCALRTNSTASVQALIAGNGVQSPSGWPTFSATTWAIVTVKATASGVSQQVNQGTPVTTAGTATIGAQRYLRLGQECTSASNPPGGAAFQTWQGRFGEWVGVADDLTGTDLTDLQEYLADKWGITL